MRKISNLVVLVSSVLLFSCQKQQEHSQTGSIEKTTTHKLTPIETQVKMVYISGGEYRPFFTDDTTLVTVSPFQIDERQVTNEEFLEFVKANPQWRKSNIKSSIYSDSTYLRDWPSDLELPPNADPEAPVTFVSWFAAKAFAESVGKRLPTLDEWEFLAMADETMPNAREKKSYSDDIIDLYIQKDRQYKKVKQSAPNYWGVYNMFDLVWEWTDDFNSILTTGDSRAGQYDDKNLFCAAGGATTASDLLNYAAFMRFSMRTAIKAKYTIANLGFRCAKDAPNQQ